MSDKRLVDMDDVWAFLIGAIIGQSGGVAFGLFPAADALLVIAQLTLCAVVLRVVSFRARGRA